ncbi:MAG: OmpA family protein [Bacteroidales bacterium]
MNKSFSYLILCFFSFNVSSGFAGDFDLKKMNPKTWFASQTLAAEHNHDDFESEKGEVIGGKTGEEIKSYMLKQAQKFKTIKGATVSTIRNGEVLKVSIPVSLLFLPNDSILLNNVQNSLGPVLTFMRRDLTRLLLTSHSDNTGSKAYITKMVTLRANAVNKWLLEQGLNSKNISTYLFDDEKPLFNNDSMENRNQNRRITFYFVPNDEMIKQAKRKRLNK